MKEMKEIIGKMLKAAEKQCFPLDGNGAGIILANGFSADTFKCVGKMPDVNQKKGKCHVELPGNAENAGLFLYRLRRRLARYSHGRLERAPGASKVRLEPC